MDRSRCFSCESELVPGKRYCFKCGVDFHKSSCNCGVELISGKRYCFKCGFDLLSWSYSGKEISGSVTLAEKNVSKEEDEEIITISALEVIDSGYRFLIMSGLEKGRSIELNRKIYTIGKLTGNKKDGYIYLDSSALSIEQAVIKWYQNSGKYSIIHKKGAINNTILNDKEISTEVFTEMESGDIIKIGNVQIMIESSKNSYAVNYHPELIDDERTLMRLPSRSNLTVQSEVEVIEGVDKGKIFRLDKDVSRIGRRSIKYPDPKEIELSELCKSISRSHARIEKKEGEFYIIKEKEENLLLVNGLSVQFNMSKPLKNGDKIKLDDKTVLLFRKK
ncbi:MAG TPA: FHA domain-containing protein [Candidatus Eremiobacteraeota bacterium]|nr:MAG: FHA domain protein [bacterium ADurb.Bin363]HPZ09489.1 FHA domain-containing protein [Candidatus Eremiobacteraeota bacterium]